MSRVGPAARSWRTCSSRAGGEHGEGEAHEGIRNEVEDALRHHCQVPDGSQVLVLVSGGSDSMALLHLLNDVKGRWSPPLQVEVAHFNHGLRPEAAEQEEKLVVETARALGVHAHVRRWEGGGDKSTGIQERARDWRRHESEAILSRRGGSGFIATAHHGDDQVETFVMKLMRGAHLSHLRGMDYRQGPYIKPLLGVSKESLRQYLQSRRLPWLEDASNAEDKYKRNKVRLRLVPLMEELAGGGDALRTRVEELSRQSRGLDAWLLAEAAKWEESYLWRPGRAEPASSDVVREDEFPLVPWRPLPLLLQEELLHRFVLRVSGGALRLAYMQVERLVDHIGRGEAQWQLALGHGYVVKCNGDVLRLLPAEASSGFQDGGGGCLTREYGDVTVTAPATWAVEVRRLEGAEGGQDGVLLFNIPLGAALELRRRQEGDRFWPAWRSSLVKMKDFLRGQKVPLHRRDDVPFIVTRGGDVACVYPTCVAAPYARDTTGVPPVWVRIGGECLYMPKKAPQS